MSECPQCGGGEWVTYSDGLGEVASVAACCLGCGYLTARSIDLGDQREGGAMSECEIRERHYYSIDGTCQRCGHDSRA